MTRQNDPIPMMHRFAYLPFAAGIWIIGKLPFRWRSNIGAWITRGPIGRLIGYRKRVERNLALIYPDMPDPERRKIADDTLSNAGRTFLENLYPRDFAKKAGPFRLHGAGVAAVDDAIKSGRPIQFVSGHFGNHEAFRNAMYDRGMPVGGLYRPMAIKPFNKFYEETLNIDGKAGPIFPIGREGTAAYRTRLKKGNVALVLLIDVATSRGERFDFLGQPAFTSTAAASFAIKADALYVPYFSMRSHDGFDVEIAAPIEHSDPLTMTQTASAELEKRITADPGNWFWVHKRWKTFGR